MDILALLGEDAGLQALQYQSIRALDLSVHARVGDCYLVYPDVVVITKIQEPFPGELGAIIGDDRVGDPNSKNNVLDKTHRLFGVNFGQGPCLDQLGEFVDHDK
jgi:hypothetical protein